MAANVTINGKLASDSPVLVVIRRPVGVDRTPDIRAAERLVRDLTGREPYVFCDGAGAVEVGASGVPARRRHAPAADSEGR